MAMRSDPPELYAAMFVGKSGYRLPADVSANLEPGRWVLALQMPYVLLALRFKLSKASCYSKRSEIKRWQTTSHIAEMFTNRRWSGPLRGKR
jgi:hypothetical protein